MIRDIVQAFVEGGIFMWPILGVLAIGVAIVLERFSFMLAASGIKKDELLNLINSYILQGDLQRAIAVASQVKSPITNIVRAGLVAVANNGGPEDVQTAMDAVALREIPKIEKRIGILATLSNLATLLGLLGTVTGMIMAFGSIANVAPAEKATILSGAISEAMHCTAFGLMTAIPILGAFGYFGTQAQQMIDEIHESSVATLNFILSNKDKFKKVS